MGKIAFTATRVAAFNCPPNKSQAFLWDATTPGLGLRHTPKGQAAYVFQGVFAGKDLRLTIGSPRAWSIPDAQAKAREYQRLIDQGLDPREQRRRRLAEDAAAKAASMAQAVVGLEVWDDYIKERKPYWGERHYEDHLAMVKEGGLPSKNHRRQMTVEGPLRGLLQLRLIDLKSEQVEEWARTQAAARATYARLSWRCLKAFLNWCAEHPTYATLLPPNNPAKTKKIREVLGKPNVKKDALQKEQLPAWFQAVQQLPNPAVSAYLQILLLTGARPGEVQALEWTNVDFTWNALTISDKVEGERRIPLTPYVRSLLEALPQRNRWVFASPRTDGPLTPHFENIKAMVEACRTFKPDWIIFDPLVSFGVGESRVNDAEQGLIEAFRVFRNHLDCCIEGIHHTGKANAREKTSDQYSGRGGSALADGSRMVVVMHPVEPQEWFQKTGTPLAESESGLVMHFAKLSYSKRPASIYVRRNGYLFSQAQIAELSEADLRRRNMDRVLEFVRSEYNKGKHLNKTELEKLTNDLDMTRQDLRESVDELLQEGSMVFHGKRGKAGGYYEPKVSASVVQTLDSNGAHETLDW